MSVRDEPMQVIVDSDSIRVVSAGEQGPASLALGSLIDGPANSVLRMTADGPVWMPVDETPIVKRLNPITQQMVSPPTVTQGVANDPSVIASSVNVPPDNAAFTYFGCRADFGLIFPNTMFYSPQNILDPAGTKDLYTVGPWGVEFEYDGSEFEVSVKGTGTQAVRRCTVDGEGYNTRFGTAGPTADGNGYLVHYDFGTAKSRRIRFDFTDSVFFGGINREPATTISVTTKSLGMSIAVIGDSFTEGTGASAPFTGFGERLGQYLGSRNVNMSGWGGTGYLNDVGGTKETFRTRVTKDIIDAAPDIVLVAGGINDQTAYVEATFETEADLLFDAIMTGLPDCALIVVGPWWPNGSPVANNIKVRDSIREKSLPYARLFIDNLGGTIPYTGTEADYKDTGWMTGTGYVTAIANDGNADFYTSSDGTHPTQAGHDYLALRLAEAIALDAPELLG